MDPTLGRTIIPVISPNVSPKNIAAPVDPFQGVSPTTPGAGRLGMPAIPEIPGPYTTPIQPTPPPAGLARKPKGGPDALLELIWTLTRLGRKAPEIAQQLGIPTSDVRKALTAATHDPKLGARLDKVRAEAARSYSSHLQARGVKILDSITDDDVKKMSIAQKSVVGGIMVDKAKVLGDVAARIDERLSPIPDAPAIPQLTDVASLVASIKSRVGRLTVLQVELDPDVRQRVEALEVVQGEALEVKE